MKELSISDWIDLAKHYLLNKRIVDIEYLDDETKEDYMWYSKPVVLILDDGSKLIPMQDDEGNDGGAFCYISREKQEHTLPVI